VGKSSTFAANWTANMENLMNKSLITFASCLSLLGACSADDAPANANPDAGDINAAPMVSYSSSSLPMLGPDYVYEGWIIVDGAPVTAGRFTVDENGDATPAWFELNQEDVDAATVYVLTIEPAKGDDPGPSDTHLLAGPINAGIADLTVDHAAAIGTDFSSAAGSYILATPTTGDMTLSEQGIWWLVPGETKTASLTLPELPDGWVYEGWVVGSAGPISTGRFTAAAGSDDDLAGRDKGDTGDGPPFPGQDFISPATVLNDGTFKAVITVEPDPDNSDKPFLIKPLAHDPIGTAVAPTQHTMVNISAATIPAASIEIL
jgi:hypothetical protein